LKATLFLFLVMSAVAADDDGTATVEDDIGKSREGSRTDDEVVDRYGSCSCKLQHTLPLVNSHS